jgi:protein unc-79
MSQITYNMEFKVSLSASKSAFLIKYLIFFNIIVYGKAILQVMGCLLPFLDRDLIDNIPYLCASLFSVLPASSHQDIINYLCYYILPFTITRQGDSDTMICQASASVSSVIMFVFQYSNNPAHHCQLLECLMALKPNVAKDLLCVIAYGTSVSRFVAAKLLFYYWPAFSVELFDRKVLLVKFNSKNFYHFVLKKFVVF